MKKVLLASTALVAFAGAAAADVALSGSAEMGIVGASSDMPSSRGEYAGTTVFHQSVDVRFTLSGEADGGLSFGAVIDLEDISDTGAARSDTADVQGDFADFTVFISGDFGTLTMGDTDGAFDWAMTEVNIGSPGSIDDDETEHAGYSGNGAFDGVEDFDGQVLRYDYSFGDFGVAVSAETDGVGDSVYNFGIGARYALGFSGGTVMFGAGYQYANDTDFANTPSSSRPDESTGTPINTPRVLALAGDQEATIAGISVAAELDMGLSGAFNYSRVETDVAGDADHMAIGVSYAFDAFTVHMNYGIYDGDAALVRANNWGEGYGLAASYDLGGGLSGHFGYGYSDREFGPDFSTYSLGLAMSF